MTEYKNVIQLRGPEADLTKATALLLTATPRAWEVHEAQLKIRPREEPCATWEFLCRRYPVDVELLSALFPTLTFDWQFKEMGDHGPDYHGSRKTLRGGEGTEEV
jgi:hypothetical protein